MDPIRSRRREPCRDEPAAIAEPQRPARLATVAETREFLRCSPSAFKRLLALGLPPAVDLAIPRPGKKRHRALRFDLQEVLRWLRARSAA